MEPYFGRVESLDDRHLSFISSEPQTFAFVLQGETEFRAKTDSGLKVEHGRRHRPGRASVSGPLPYEWPAAGELFPGAA